MRTLATLNPIKYTDGYMKEKLTATFIGVGLAVVIDENKERHFFNAEHVRNQIIKTR